MTYKYLDIHNSDSRHVQIIYHVDNHLYRIIEFDIVSAIGMPPETVATIKAENIVDLYLRQNGLQILIESVERGTDKKIIQNIVERFKERMNILYELQDIMMQIQQKKYKVKMSYIPQCDCSDDTLYAISIYAGKHKIAEGEYLKFWENNSALLSLKNKSLTHEDFVAVFLYVFEIAKQDFYEPEIKMTFYTNIIKPNIVRKGDMAFECKFMNYLYRNVKTIDIQSNEIRIAGDPYAIVSVPPARENYEIILIDKDMYVDRDVLAPYLL